jgi:hypothetical protein
MVNQRDHWNTPVTGSVLTMLTFCSPPLILCLFKATAHVCIWKMTEDELKCLLCLFPRYFTGYIINLLSLPFIVSLYLAYRGEWPDLTCGSPGIWFRPGPSLGHM